MKPPRSPRSPLPNIVVPAIRCPYCDHVRHLTTKTMKNGDGSITRFVKCRRCDCSFKITTDPSLLIPAPGIAGKGGR
jgi:transcription elongation factor Elf1